MILESQNELELRYAEIYLSNLKRNYEVISYLSNGNVKQKHVMRMI